MLKKYEISIPALTRDNTAVPVTVTCQSHLTPPPSALPPGGFNQNHHPGLSMAPPGVGTTSDGRNIWSGTLPPSQQTEGAKRQAKAAPATAVSKNTGNRNLLPSGRGLHEVLLFGSM